MAIEPHPPQPGELCAWVIPQVPGTPFRVPVASIADGRRTVDLLTAFSAFEYLENIKPDYSEVSGVARWEQIDGAWDWYEVDDDETDPPPRSGTATFNVEFDSDAWASASDEDRQTWVDDATRALAIEVYVSGVQVNP